MEFPPNSDASKTNPQGEPKKVKRVTSGDPVRRKKSLGKQFRETFVAGSAKMAAGYVVFDVLLPAARDMIVESGQAYLDKLIYGESRRRRGTTTPSSGPTGYVSYNRVPMGTGQYPIPPSQRVLNRQARARHDFDEIVLESRIEAEEVIDNLFNLVSKYDSATVADLYELVGIAATHVDGRWGWKDLRGAGVTRVREGYLLDLPEPVPLTG